MSLSPVWDSGLLPKDGGGWSFLKKKDGAGFESFSSTLPPLPAKPL